MTTATDPRQFRADSILANAGQWLRIRSKDGRPLAFGIPSTRDPSHVHLVRPDACTCPDSARGRHCKHRYAVAAYCQRRRAALATEQPSRPVMPPSVVANAQRYDAIFGQKG